MSAARSPHPIETESYRRMRALADFTHLPPLSRAVAERVVHASADLGYLDDLVLDEDALAAGSAALAAGAPLVVDVRMVAAGITTAEAICGLDDPRTLELTASSRGQAEAPAGGLTRSAAGISVALQRAGDGAVVAIGNAPTALFEVLRLVEAQQTRPALVVGLPVGFVDAVESKQALRAARLPAVSNRSRKGGSAVASAAINALLYAEPDRGPATP